MWKSTSVRPLAAEFQGLTPEEKDLDELAAPWKSGLNPKLEKPNEHCAVGHLPPGYS